MIKKGFVANPLLKISRNEKCPCGSKNKFKKCCLDKIVKYIPSKIAEAMKDKSIIEQTYIYVAYLKGDIKESGA